MLFIYGLGIPLKLENESSAMDLSMAAYPYPSLLEDIFNYIFFQEIPNTTHIQLVMHEATTVPARSIDVFQADAKSTKRPDHESCQIYSSGHHNHLFLFQSPPIVTEKSTMKKRQPLSLCTCKSHCRTFNAVTSRYEGIGRWIPRGTRDDHVRDEKRGRSLITLGGKTLDSPPPPSISSGPSTQYPTSDNSPSEDRDKSLLKCFEDEFLYLTSCPTTSLTKPLIFLNDPDLNGEFISPEFEEMLMGNSGKYALCPHRQANEAFIHIEYRCCNMLAHLGNIKGTEERDALALAISDHLVYLNHQKGIQWARYRGTVQGATSGPALLVVNTGEKFFCFGYFRVVLTIKP